MLSGSEIKEAIVNGLQGIVLSLGAPSPKIDVIDRPDGNGKMALVRQGFEVKLFEGARANKRTHHFEDLGSFAAWLLKHADPNVVEILVDETVVFALLDPKNPNGDIVICPLAIHPTAQRWFDAIERTALSQKEVAKLIVSALCDFDDTSTNGVVGSYGSELAIQIRKFNAVKDSEVTVEIDELGVTTFQAVSEKTKVSGSLPPTFDVHVPLYLGIKNDDDQEPTYDLQLFLEILVREKAAPLFNLSAPNLKLTIREARLEAANFLQRLLNVEGKPPFLVGLGKASTALVPAPQR